MTDDFKIEDQPVEIQNKVRRAAGLGKQNEQMLQRLAPVLEIEPTGWKLQFFLRAMVTAGIIDEDFFWSTSVEWEEELRKRLQNITQQVEEQVRKAQLTQGVPRVNGKKLIIPGS